MGANGEDPRRLAVSGQEFSFYSFAGLRWAPDGRRIAYLKRRHNSVEFAIETLDPDGGPATVIRSDPRIRDFCWAPDGRIIYGLWESPNEANSNLWEVRIDPQTGRASGEHRRITNWAGFDLYDLQITADGKRLTFVKRRDQSDVYLGELEANRTRLKAPRRLTLDDRIDWPGGWTRDSKAVLFYSVRYGDLDIFKQGVRDRAPEGIVVGLDDKREPQLSPDGSWILYLAWPKMEGHEPPKTGRLMRVRVAGGSPEFVIEARGYPGPAHVPRDAGHHLTIRGQPAFRCPSLPTAPCVLSELDQRQIVFSAFDPVQGKKGEIARVDINPFTEAFWDLSPDGSRIAFGETDKYIGRLRILALRGGAAREITVKGWTNIDSVAWSAGGDYLFVTKWSSQGGSLLRVDLTGAAQPLRKAIMYIERPIPSPDGRYLAFGEVSSESNAWMIENLR
jgi:Tol biopolymer transport system component